MNKYPGQHIFCYRKSNNGFMYTLCADSKYENCFSPSSLVFQLYRAELGFWHLNMILCYRAFFMYLSFFQPKLLGRIRSVKKK